ncbi:rhodanese-like domain-containing protein [Amycolatopsis sp. lyj-109]|uniref:rhodanese-like domain-containing protein n=1 Tax=Amycolatopsis sp. lyj-109 TaxID=2789287 RepID=UPI00397E52F5
MTRYVVIGAGAVGATVAAQLHLAGRRVTLIARGDHLDALRTKGLRYVRPRETRVIDVPVAGGPDEIELRPDDVLVVATKSQDTEAVLRTWAWQPVDASTAAAELPVVLLQNGLENDRAALRRFAGVIGAVVWMPSSHLEPGEVVAPSPGALWLGAYPGGGHPRLAGIAEDLTAAGFHVEVVPGIQRLKAGKLVGNTVNVLDALYRPSDLRAAAARILKQEARTVLGTDDFVPAVDLGEPVKRGGSSTWQSLRRGAAPETDFLNGEIVLQARLAGLDAPYNAALTERIHRAGEIAPGSLDDADLVATLPDLPRRAVLADAAELHALIEAGQAPVLLDVRWALGDPHGHDHYRAGHIPGAVYVDLDSRLAAPPGPAGRHPLPDVGDLQAAARSWGVTARRPIVVYDDNGGTAAARAWWLLRWAGLDDVRILDGSLASWRAHGFALSTGDETATAGDVVLTGGRLPTLTTDEAAALAETGVLLDARATERYRGEVEPVDPRAGHIPGARSAPTTDNLRAGFFRPTGELREKYGDLGGAKVGVYCGSGVTAAHEIAALAVAGIPAALYPGSWSAWSADPARPVATGEDS